MQEQENFIAEGGFDEPAQIPEIPVKEEKPKRHWTNKEEVTGWLFASIPLIGFLIFGLIPLIMSFYVAFNQFDDLHLFPDFSDEMFPHPVTFVGFSNFTKVLSDPEFWQSILNTLFVVFTTVFSLALSVFISMMLYHSKKGKKFFQTVFFIPYVCSLVAVTFMWQWIFDGNQGIINSLLWQLGIYKTDKDVIMWLTNSADSFRFMMFVIFVWSGTGFNIILLSASMTNINKSCYEAADIDGAGMFTKFFKITLPAISPTIFYLLVTGIMGSLQEFTRFQVMSDSGGPKGAGITIVFYLYRELMKRHDIGVASAVGWILALLIGLVTFGNFKLSKKWVSYDE